MSKRVTTRSRRYDQSSWTTGKVWSAVHGVAVAVAVTVTLALALGVGGAPAVAQSAGDDVASRVPRFLLASTESRAPVRATPEEVPVLLRRLSLALDDATVGEALAEIARQSGLRLMYSNAVVPARRTVRLKADRITVAAALTEVLIDTGVDVVFEKGGRAMLVRRPGGATPRSAGAISGYVRDTGTAKGVANAEVVLDGTRWRATTDSVGWYRLADVDTGAYAVVVRRVGYRRQARRVRVPEGQEVGIDFDLVPVAVALDELVSTATGKQRRRDIGSAVTTIYADSLMRNAPVKNLTDLLENRVTGMTLRRTSGAPGDPSRLRLRGLGSVLRGNDPVVYVDGVRVYSAHSDTRSGSLTNLVAVNDMMMPDRPAPSPLDQIDPSIIEKIDVLKGSAATTQFGADAANGVIVITTKKGRAGPTRWTSSLTYGRSSTPGRWPEAYFRWGHSVVSEGGQASRFCFITSPFCRQDSLVRMQVLNDPELTILGSGRLGAIDLGASGGAQSLTYMISGRYSDEVGMLKLPDYEIGRFRERFHRDAPDWMRRPQRYAMWSLATTVQARLGSNADVSLGTTVTRSQQRRSTLESRLSQVATTYFDRATGQFFNATDESLNPPGAPGDFLTEYYRRTTHSTITFGTRLNAEWRPAGWLSASAQAGIDLVPREDQLLLPAKLVTPTDSGGMTLANGRSLISTLNAAARARKPLGRGFVFTTTVGANLTTTSTNDVATSASGLEPGTTTLAGAAVVRAYDSRLSSSVFGWYVEPMIVGERFSFSTGVRLDGGSAYGARVARGDGALGGLLALPRLSGTWTISDEPWFPFAGMFSSLRLRGAYGQAQRQPGPADRLRLYDHGVSMVQLGNTLLRPERTQEIEAGFDAEILDSRVTLELTATRKTTIDAIMPYALPTSVNGGGEVLTNIGTVRNTGVELRLGLTPVRSQIAPVRTDLLYTGSANRLAELGRGVPENREMGWVAGYPVASRWAKPILGFIDHNANGVVELDELRVGGTPVFMGQTLPVHAASLHADLELFDRAIGLNASFEYEDGASQMNNVLATGQGAVLAPALFDPATPLSEQAAVIAYRNPDHPNFTPYGLIQEISLLRFKTLSLSYRASPGIARRFRARSLSVAVRGSNLGLHTNYRGKDPNVNAWSPGEGTIDTGQIPLPREWSVRVDLGF